MRGVVWSLALGRLRTGAAPKPVFEIIHKKWIICDMIEYERDCLIVTLIENVIRSA